MLTSPGTPEDNARFEKIVTKTLVNEGGAKIYSDAATGELSKFGISLKFFQGIHPGATEHDITDLTEEGAKWLYMTFFYENPKLYRISDDDVLYKVFDLGVNNGPSTAIRLLQRAIKSLGVDIKVDGQLGPQTAAAANSLPPKELLAEIKTHAAARYKLIAQDPKNAKNLPGWLARLEKA